jgi:uncharacterized membrane protein
MRALPYLKTAVILFLVDLFWILTGGIFFRDMIENIQGEQLRPRWLSAALVYLFMAYMLLETSSYLQAFTYGICIYAIYDLTNYALFEQYEWKLAIADILWGGLLFTFVRYLLLHVF